MTCEATKDEIRAGRGYESLFVPALFAPWTKPVIKYSDLDKGADVLDVACGSGVLARAVREHIGGSGKIVGLDPAPGMIAAAGEVEPNIEWVLGRAEDMSFADATFDNVVSQFGVMFFQDRLKAISEMYRVTRPGGKLTLAIWNSVSQNPAYRDIASLLDQHVSPAAAEAVKIPFCLGNPEEVARLISQVGFVDVEHETHYAQAEFPSPRSMVEVELRGWLPLFDIHLDEAEIADVLTKSDPVLTKYASSSGSAVFTTSAYIMTARRPM